MAKESPLRQWLLLATPEERELLAEKAGTSPLYLRMLAADGKSYQRHAGSELAAKIEAASLALHRKSKGRLPRLYRTQISKTCAGCLYAKSCLGAGGKK